MFGVFLLLLSSVSFAHDVAPPACNQTPCVLGYDGGGDIDAYKQLADRLKRTKEPLEIAGECYSACTILADLARPYVCIRPGAKFFFHKLTVVSGPRIGERKNITYSLDLYNWIEGNGGQPSIGWLEMNYTTSLQFWPTCEKIK